MEPLLIGRSRHLKSRVRAARGWHRPCMSTACGCVFPWLLAAKAALALALACRVWSVDSSLACCVGAGLLFGVRLVRVRVRVRTRTRDADAPQTDAVAGSWGGEHTRATVEERVSGPFGTRKTRWGLELLQNTSRT